MNAEITPTVMEPRMTKMAPKTATSSTITIRLADPSEYKVRIDCGDEALTIPSSVDLYAMVQITTKNLL